MRGRESRWARAAPWRERGRSEQEHEEERMDSTVKEGRFQEEGGQARRASLEQVEGSMSGRVDAIALPSLGFTPSLAKTEIGKGGWETKCPLFR